MRQYRPSSPPSMKLMSRTMLLVPYTQFIPIISIEASAEQLFIVTVTSDVMMCGTQNEDGAAVVVHHLQHDLPARGDVEQPQSEPAQAAHLQSVEHWTIEHTVLHIYTLVASHALIGRGNKLPDSQPRPRRRTSGLD